MKFITSKHIESEGRHLFINHEVVPFDTILLITDVDSIDFVPQNRIRIVSSEVASKLHLRNYIPLFIEKSVSIGPFEIKMIENINDNIFSYMIKDSSESLLVMTDPPFLPAFDSETDLLIAGAYPLGCEETLHDYRQFFSQKRSGNIYIPEDDIQKWQHLILDKNKIVPLPHELRQLSLF